MTGLCCRLADCSGCQLEKAPRAGNTVLARAGLCWNVGSSACPGITQPPQKGRHLNTHLGAGGLCSLSWGQCCAGAVGAVPALCPASPAGPELPAAASQNPSASPSFVFLLESRRQRICILQCYHNL